MDIAQIVESKLDDREQMLALLLQVLTDAELTRQRQAGGDPWIFNAPNPSWPNMRLYRNLELMRSEIPKFAPDPQLFGAYMDSLRGTGAPVGGFYSDATRTVLSPYNSDILEHELRHYFFPEQQHPWFENIQESIERLKKQKQK